ncbi:MAG: nitroreductase family protein [Candidatus Omnitrophica bacterium]|nr:nitroreductase family protein [Candidatus Omnitrophota bacterium]
MDFLELAKKRQSTRDYSPKVVPRESIDRCIEAARLAPSACNSQPWSFIVVDREPMRTKLASGAFGGIYAMNSFAKKAPVFIVVITERAPYITRLGGYLKGVQYSLIDIGIACEHLILEAEELGMGTCWLGWFDERFVKNLLKVPKDKKVDVIISMGYPEEGRLRDKSRRPLDEIRRFAE